MSSTTFKRNRRSSRNWPEATAASRSRLDAAISRTSARARAVLTDAFVAPFLEEAEQFRLEQERQVADLVEEQRASLGRGDFSLGVGDGAGERAARVPEQVAFQQVGIQARAAHGDKRRRACGGSRREWPGRTPLCRSRSLPGSRPTASVAATWRPCSRTMRTCGSPLSSDTSGTSTPICSCRSAIWLCKRPDPLEPFEHGADLRGRERLGQVIERTPPHGIDGAVDAGIRRDDHDGQPRREPCKVSSRSNPDSSPSRRSTNATSNGDRSIRCDASGEADGLLDRVLHRLESDPQALSDVGFVVDDQDAHGLTGKGTDRLHSEAPPHARCTAANGTRRSGRDRGLFCQTRLKNSGSLMMEIGTPWRMSFSAARSFEPLWRMT